MTKRSMSTDRTFRRRKTPWPKNMPKFEDHPEALAQQFSLKRAIILGRSLPVTPLYSTASPLDEI
jgi:hypothetical protein